MHWHSLVRSYYSESPLMLIVSSFLILCALFLTRGRPASRLGPAENAGRRGVGSRCAAWARAGPAGRLYRWWAAKLAPTPNPLDTAADLELFVACLSAGLSPARAAAAVATTSSCAAWRSTASLLSLGVDADRAWRELAQAPGLGELAALARSSHHSGAGLSNGCSRIAARLRDDGADHATAEAERAGVLIALPMTLCYLPAFFLLGLAPMVISLGTSILSSH